MTVFTLGERIDGNKREEKEGERNKKGMRQTQRS
jgi:hypothetical protein